MVGTLTVQNLQGPASGANANKVIIPSGHELHASGHVLQVVSVEETGSALYSTQLSTVDLFSATITPTSATSKILVSINVQWGINSTNGDFGLFLKRGSTRIGGRTNDAYRGGSNVWFANDDRFGAETQQEYNLLNASWQYLDTPNTTSATTYTVGVGVGTVFALNRHWAADNGGTSTITLMEIAQ